MEAPPSPFPESRHQQLTVESQASQGKAVLLPHWGTVFVSSDRPADRSLRNVSGARPAEPSLPCTQANDQRHSFQAWGKPPDLAPRLHSKPRVVRSPGTCWEGRWPRDHMDSLAAWTSRPAGPRVYLGPRNRWALSFLLNYSSKSFCLGWFDEKVL